MSAAPFHRTLLVLDRNLDRAQALVDRLDCGPDCCVRFKLGTPGPDTPTTLEGVDCILLRPPGEGPRVADAIRGFCASIPVEVPVLLNLVSSEVEDLDPAVCGAAGYVHGGVESCETIHRAMEMALNHARLSARLKDHADEQARLASRLRGALELVHDPLVVVNGDGVVRSWNFAAEVAFGLPAGDVIGSPLQSFIPELEMILERLAAHEGSPGPGEVIRTIGRVAGGEAVALEVSGSVEGDASDRAFVLVIRDVSAQLATQRAVDHLVDEYELLLNSAGDGIVGLDTRGRVTFTNPAADRILGDAKPDADGSFIDFLAEHRGRSDKDPSISLRMVLDWGKSCTCNLTFMTADQSTPIEVHGRPLVREGQVLGAVLILEDLSDRQRLEGQLRQAQKMEVLGQLSGGLAHDFNNELAVIQLNIEMILDDLERNEMPDRAAVEDITRGVERASRLTRQLLSMSRQVGADVRVVDLAQVLRSLSKLLRKFTPESIDVRWEIENDIFPVRLDVQGLEQVLLNLTTNARDAMPEGGVLTLRLSTERLGRALYLPGPLAVTLPAGRYHRLDVVDTGSGMTAETLSRIAEPFFTTKPKGQGTGLGLPMVCSIIQKLEGGLSVQSEPGEGTTVSIYLPAAASSVDARPGKMEPWSGSGEGFTVLVAEDEPGLRGAVAMVLRKYGFGVVAVENGEQAWEVYRTAEPAVDIILSDNIMPGMTGLELFAAIGEAQGDPPPFILTTGYSDANLDDLHGLHLLPKPWNTRQLLDLIWAKLHPEDDQTPPEVSRRRSRTAGSA